MKRLVLLVLVLFVGALSAQEKAVEQIPGDINRDGTVDFQDFVELAKNFGKTGPPPTPVTPDTVTVEVEVEVIVRDTIRIRETIQIPGPSARVTTGSEDVWLLDVLLGHIRRSLSLWTHLSGR